MKNEAAVYKCSAKWKKIGPKRFCVYKCVEFISVFGGRKAEFVGFLLMCVCVCVCVSVVQQ